MRGLPLSRTSGLGTVLLAGAMRVPRPALGTMAVVTLAGMRLLPPPAAVYSGSFPSRTETGKCFWYHAASGASVT